MVSASSVSMVVAESGLIPLDEAYERCRCETEEWAKTFYLGTMLMPPEKRRAIWAIYVWCRRTDEIMDSPEALSKPKEMLLELLDQWECHTRSVFDGRAVNWLDQVMVDTILLFDLSLQPYLDMIEGMRMDLTWTRYSTFEELKLYCYRVAGTVGLMSERVMGVDPGYTSAPWSTGANTSGAAVALGIANQLTNILRDVGEDRHRGRIYLPLEDLQRFDYTEEQLFNGVVNDAWKRLMAFQIDRARQWFRQSEEGVRFLAPDARWPVWTSLRLYRGILSRIEQNQYDVFNHRAYVPKYRKLIDLPFSFLLSQSQ